jgi:hypothetical protein
MSAIFRFIYTGIVFRKANLENCRVTEQLRRAAVELPELFADYISALRRITELQDLTTTSSGGICPDPAATSSASHLSCMSTLSALPSTAVSTTGHWFGATVSDASSTFAAPMASAPCVSTFSAQPSAARITTGLFGAPAPRAFTTTATSGVTTSASRLFGPSAASASPTTVTSVAHAPRGLGVGVSPPAAGSSACLPFGASVPDASPPAVRTSTSLLFGASATTATAAVPVPCASLFGALPVGPELSTSRMFRNPASGASRTTAASAAPVPGVTTFGALTSEAWNATRLPFGAPAARPSATIATSAETLRVSAFGTLPSTAATNPIVGCDHHLTDREPRAPVQTAPILPAAPTGKSQGAQATILSAAQYAKELGLDADDSDDVQADLDSARKAWVQVLGSATKQYQVPARQEGAVDGEGEDDAVLSELMTILGTTYSGEEHGAALEEAAGGSALSLEAFTDWYMRWLYKNEDSTEEDGSCDDYDDSSTSSVSCNAVTSTVHTSETHAGSGSELLTAAQYFALPDLLGDNAEDLQSDIDAARVVWLEVLGGATRQYDIPARQRGEKDVVLCQLVELMGKTYRRRADGRALRKAAGGSALSLEAFTDWWIRWYYEKVDY